jgi:diamine N-acetyltransferase
VYLGVEECRRRNATELFTSWVLGDGGPEGFYLGLGFEPTGEWDDDEKVARLVL